MPPQMASSPHSTASLLLKSTRHTQSLNVTPHNIRTILSFLSSLTLFHHSCHGPGLAAIQQCAMHTRYVNPAFNLQDDSLINHYWANFPKLLFHTIIILDANASSASPSTLKMSPSKQNLSAITGILYISQYHIYSCNQ